MAYGPLGGFAGEVALESPYDDPAATPEGWETINPEAPAAVTGPAVGPLGAPEGGPAVPVAEPTPMAPAQPDYTPENNPPPTPEHPAAPIAAQAPLVRVRSTNYAQGGRDKAGSDPDTDAGRTSTGGPLVPYGKGVAGTVAVDPKVIPYGSVIRTANGEVYVAADTGGAVKSRKASKDGSPVIDLFNGEHHPDYQDVQIFKPSVDYLKLTPEQKLAYHKQAAQTFNGLAPGLPGVGTAAAGGQADPSKLTPENVQAEIATSSADPALTSAASRRGPLGPPSQSRSMGDSETITVLGNVDKEGNFTPNSALAPDQRGNYAAQIPAFITKKMPDGSEQTFHSDEYGQPKGAPIKNIPASQMGLVEQMRAAGLPDTEGGQLLAKLSQMNQKGTRGMAMPNLIQSVSGNMKKGMSFQEAIDSIKAPDLALLQKMETDFKNNQANRQVEAAVIPAYEKVKRIAGLPMSQRSAEQDKIVMDAMTTLSTPNRAGTVADQREQEKARGGLPSKIREWKNWLTGNPGANIPDDAMREIEKAADAEFAAVATEYNVRYEDVKNKVLKAGGDTSVFMPRNLIDEVRARREQQMKDAQQGRGEAKPAATAPGAAAAAPKVDEEIAKLPPSALGTDGRVKMVDPKTGTIYQVEQQFFQKAKAGGFKPYGQ